MSYYFIKGKGWRYDFTLKGTRHTGAWFKTKTEAKQAEAKKREEVKNPQPVAETLTDISFLELINKRLDHVKAYNSAIHYEHYYYMARRWVKKWSGLLCGQISQDMVQKHILERSMISAYAANKDIRYLKAAFNFGKKKSLLM
ncbi:MAG: hypothetical protein ACMUJM_10860 [bacterium]